MVMNCEGVPSINLDVAPRDLSTDHVAFHATAEDEPFEHLPTSSFWQYSLKHCREGFQASPCGAATYIFCRVGCRAYFLAWKKKGPTLDGFVRNSFGEWCPADDWDIEMVLLPAGSML